ncbi:MAG: hypothetical protein KDI18_08010 [Gammaproteobacteria bacterium]|nr:hypothetical protein [Gammaproteobacteria bacterium]
MADEVKSLDPAVAILIITNLINLLCDKFAAIKDAAKVAETNYAALIDSAQLNCKEAFASGLRFSARIDIVMNYTNNVPGLN